MLSTTTIDVDRVAASFPTIDAMETELQRLEGLISRVRARQVEILAAVDQLQVPAWDGCRSLQEWIAGRLDMQPATLLTLRCWLSPAQRKFTTRSVPESPPLIGRPVWPASRTPAPPRP